MLDEVNLKIWTSNHYESLRYDYPELNTNSVVWDVGGYGGDFTDCIHKKYGCRVFCFEPVMKFYQKIHDRFKDNDKITVFPFGLSSTNQTVHFSVDHDSSHQTTQNQDTVKVAIKSFKDVMLQQKIDRIHLLKLNIEGGEYELLDYILKHKLQFLIDNIQVQFHRIDDTVVERRQKIVDVLIKTHTPTYQYAFLWENYRRKI